MATPTIAEKYYSVLLSATQDTARCIEFDYTLSTLGQIFSCNFTFSSQPDEGDSFSVDGTTYTFTTSAPPESDLHISIGASLSATRDNTLFCLLGGPNFELYNYASISLGLNGFIIYSKQKGVKYNREINTSLSPTLSYIITAEGSYEAYLPNYKIVVDILVDSKPFSTIYTNPVFKRFDIVNNTRKILMMDLNAVLKDAVYTPDPDPDYTGIKLYDTISKSVELRIFEQYDGFNGYEAGEILTSVDGRIMNARGLNPGYADITNAEDYNNLAEAFYPSSSNYPVSFFLEKPYQEYSIDICYNDPISTHFTTEKGYMVST